MKQYISVFFLIFLMSISSQTMANPTANIDDCERGYHNPVTAYNDSSNYIAIQFGRLPDEQMIDLVVNPHSSAIYYSGIVHRKQLLFVYFKVENSTTLLFKSDFKLYNTALIKSIRITSPEKGYVVTCLDGGSESCVAH